MQVKHTDDHMGHRQRLMDKVLKDSCCEHEFLEMLLCYSIPRRNTNNLAHRLLAEFGNIEQILAATPEQLQNVEGVGKSTAVLFKCLHKFYQEFLSSHADYYVNCFPEAYDKEGFVSFVCEYYKRIPYEVFDVYFLDDNSRFFRRKSFTMKKDGIVLIDVGELARLLTLLHPSGLVLVHNHPSGSFVPSKADDQATCVCQYLCNVHNMLLCNHLVVSPEGVFDYYVSGKLEEINVQCTVYMPTELDGEQLDGAEDKGGVE